MTVDWVWEQTRDEVTVAYEGLVTFGIHSVEALLIVVLAVAVSRALRRRVRRSRFTGRLGANLTALFANAVAIGAYILAATFILGLFGANWTALLAFLSVSTVAVSLSFQDVLKNFIAGVYILLERPFSIGQRIKVRDFDGLVESIDIRTTVLRNDNEERVIVPNAVMFTEILTNRSTYPMRRNTVLIDGIQAAPNEIEQLIRSALNHVEGIDEREPTIAWRSLSEDGSSVTVDIWHPVNDLATSDVLSRLREAFPRATITTGAV